MEKTMDTFQDRKCESIRTFWDLRKPRTIKQKGLQPRERESVHALKLVWLEPPPQRKASSRQRSAAGRSHRLRCCARRPQGSGAVPGNKLRGARPTRSGTSSRAARQGLLEVASPLLLRPVRPVGPDASSGPSGPKAFTLPIVPTMQPV